MPRTKLLIAAKTVHDPQRVVSNHAEGAGFNTDTVEVKFGQVTVWATKPSDAAIRRNVKASVKVARALGKRLLKSGVTLRHPKGVPVFMADPSDPRRVIRRLHGRSERGTFVNGKFQPENVLCELVTKC